MKPRARRIVEWYVPEIDMDAHHAYVVWSASNPSECLYVGRSSEVIHRIGTHTRTAAWTRDIGRIQLYEFRTAKQAAAAEIALISALQPTQNGMVPDFLDGVFMSWKPRGWTPKS